MSSEAQEADVIWVHDLKENFHGGRLRPGQAGFADDTNEFVMRKMTGEYIFSKGCHCVDHWYISNPFAPSFFISTAAELAELAAIVNGTFIYQGQQVRRDNFEQKTVTLTADIDLSGYSESEGWIPIGDMYSHSGEFCGKFVGGGHIISNLTINRPNAYYQGLFGYVGPSNTMGLDNIRLENATVCGYCQVGSIAGRVGTTPIKNCYSTGTVSGYNSVGGIVGWTDSGTLLEYNSFTGSVAGYGYTGGVVGGAQYGVSINNCYFAGEVSGTHCYVGGIAGWIQDGSHLNGCYSTGSVIALGVAGGIAGYAHNGSVYSCHSSGTVSSIGRGDEPGTDAGGIVGHCSVSNIVDCSSSGTINGNDRVGGIVGFFYNGSLTQSASNSEVSGHNATGGVVGRLHAGGAYNCYSTGTVSGERENTGGVAGHVLYGTVSRCYSTGKVRTGNNAINTGGVAGSLEYATAHNCYSINTVTGENRFTGGVVGRAYEGTIRDCYSTGAVRGADFVGGIAGDLSYSEISGCYAVGACSGTERVGGIVGGTWARGGTRVGNACAALNPEVRGDGPDVGRVFGFIDNGAVDALLAWDGLKNINNTVDWLNTGADNVDGEDISAAAIRADGTLGGRFTEMGGWTVENGKLSGIGQAVDMPEHLI